MQSTEHSNYENSFRDSLATISETGKRLWVYAKQPKGKFYNLRTLFAGFLLAFFFGMPFIKYNGESFLLLNFLDRKFILFGTTFWPQDSYVLALMMLSVFVFLILFTVVYGRIWCGWICPQTIFLEHLFRRVEYWIEGTHIQQKKLNEGPWNFNKTWRKILKYSVFMALSFLIISTLSSYLIGIDALLNNYTLSFAEKPGFFSATIGFTLAFYFVYTWFREQVCTLVCPYGRLQGVILDADSILVSYDYKRGEPRGRSEKEGDCIDCLQCVAVCPTRIDIRNGTQLECVQCTACIDACDAVMERTGKPKGLIRYASESTISKGIGLRFTFRIIGYSTILAAILIFLSVLLFNRTQIETTILRTPGLLYQIQDNTDISNLYNYKIVNKSHETLPVTFKLENMKGEIKNMQGDTIYLAPGKRIEGSFFVILRSETATQVQMSLEFGTYKKKKKIESINNTFISPSKH